MCFRISSSASGDFLGCETSRRQSHPAISSHGFWRSVTAVPRRSNHILVLYKCNSVLDRDDFAVAHASLLHPPSGSLSTTELRSRGCGKVALGMTSSAKSQLLGFVPITSSAGQGILPASAARARERLEPEGQGNYGKKDCRPEQQRRQRSEGVRGDRKR
jgi:hypothetical protein